MNLPHKSLFISLGFMLMGFSMQAQDSSMPQVTIHRLSAEEAVKLALQQRTEILNAKLDLLTQEAYNKEITGQAMPQVSGNLALSKLFKIPVTVLPDFISPSVYNVLENEDVRDGSGNPIKFDGVINTFPAQFGVPWQSSVGISVQQIIFQPDVFVGLQARSSALELYKRQLSISEDSVKSNVFQAYYGVLVAEKGYQYTKESLDRLQKLFDEQTQLFKAGFIERLDIDKTKVNLNNVNTTSIQLKNLIQNSYAGLKYALGLPQKDSLVLTDQLIEDWVRKDILALEDDFTYDNRNEIKALEASDDLLALQVKRYKMQSLPTIVAQWNLASNAQRLEFDFLKPGGRWFFSNTLGLNMSVPIFNGWQRTNRVKQAQYALEKNQNTVNQFRQVIDLQIISSRTTLTNAIEALNNQEDNKALAEKVFNTTRIKYQQGLGSSFEVLQSETDLQQALNQYYQALYNAGIARIAYMRSLGKL